MQSLSLLKNSDQNAQSQYLTDSLIALGEVAHLHSDLELSEELLTKALKFSDSLDLIVHASVLIKLMSPLLQLFKVKEALEISFRGLNLLSGNTEHLLLKRELYLKQAGCYFCLDELENARISATLALGIEDSDKNITSLFISASCHEIIADSYLKEGLFEQSLQSALAGGRILMENFPKEKVILYFNGFIVKFAGHPLSEELIEQLSSIFDEVDEKSPEFLNSLKLISGFYYNNQRFEESLKYAEKILKIVKKSQNITEIFEAYCNAGKIYLGFDVDTAKNYVDLAQGIFDAYPDKVDQKFLSILKFYYYAQINEFDTAEKYALFCIENTSESQEDLDELIKYYAELSGLYFTTMKSEKSIKLELKILELLEKYEKVKTDRAIPCLGRLAASYSRVGNYEKGLEYAFTAVEFMKKYFPDSTLHYLFIYVTIMNIYSSMGEYSLALNQGLELLPLIESNPRADEIYVSFHFELGNIYEKLLNKVKAKEHYLKVKDQLIQLSGQEMLILVEEKLSKLNE
jgi:tetratricopeptide (TPR) repeat protein